MTKSQFLRPASFYRPWWSVVFGRPPASSLLKSWVVDLPTLQQIVKSSRTHVFSRATTRFLRIVHVQASTPLGRRLAAGRQRRKQISLLRDDPAFLPGLPTRIPHYSLESCVSIGILRILRILPILPIFSPWHFFSFSTYSVQA